MDSLNLPLSGPSACFLLVSDVHSNVVATAALSPWLASRGVLIDAILLLGDISDMEGTDRTTAELVAQAEGDMSAVIGALENICAKVIYIPGNHDPSTAFEKPAPRLTPYSHNVHQRLLRLGSGLVVAGFGGAGPGMRSGQPAWKGYPFKTEEEIAAVLPGFGSEVASAMQAGDRLILMTHTGPNSSGTTVDRRNPDPRAHVYAGSEAIDQLLLSPALKKALLVNVHGHIHPASGMTQHLGRVPVINPGSLTERKFGILTLSRDSAGLWAFDSVSFHNLPAPE